MICNKCNSENSNGSIFCNKCGAEIQNKEETEKSKGKFELTKNKKIFIILSVSVLAFSSLLIMLYMINPVKAFENEIKSNNVKVATELYNEKIKGNIDKENKSKTFLIDEINSVKDLFKNRKIEYKEAKERIKSIKETNLVVEEAKVATQFIEELNNSRISYEKAKKYQNEYILSEAIKEYGKVIEEDENYETSRKEIEKIIIDYKRDVIKQAEESFILQDYKNSVLLLKEASSLIHDDADIIAKLAVYEKKLEEKTIEEKKQKAEKAKSEQLVVVERSRIIVQSSEYKSLYPDMIQAIIKNNSDKTIKAMEVASLGFDSNGYPLKIKTQFSFSGGNYEFVGKGDDVNIVSGARFGENVGWNLDETHGISTVLSIVKNVKFYDGETWENPYYQYWIEEYKEKPLN